MDREQKEFLEEQLKWTKNQILILDKMDVKLQEMKKIAKYAAETDSSSNEREILNSQLEMLKKEYELLENQRNIVFH